MMRSRAIVGLLLSQDAAAPAPERLLAQVQGVKTNPSGSQIAIKLTFPEKIMVRQEPKRKERVKTLK